MTSFSALASAAGQEQCELVNRRTERGQTICNSTFFPSSDRFHPCRISRVPLTSLVANQPPRCGANEVQKLKARDRLSPTPVAAHGKPIRRPSHRDSALELERIAKINRGWIFGSLPVCFSAMWKLPPTLVLTDSCT